MARTKSKREKQAVPAGDIASELPADLREIHDFIRESVKDPDFRVKFAEILKPKVKTG